MLITAPGVPERIAERHCSSRRLERLRGLQSVTVVSERKKWSVNGSGRLDTVGVDRMERLTVVDCDTVSVLVRSVTPVALPLCRTGQCAVRTVGGSRHVASFAAAFYTFSPLRDSLSTLLDPANCRRCMLPCTGYPRRARAAARSATDARPRTTTAHECSSGLAG